MSSYENTLVSEYNFSETPAFDVETNVMNWWNVCLNNRRVSFEYTEQDWSNENLELSKLYLYNYYCRTSIGERVGVLRFWAYFKQLVHVISETHDTVTIATYEECLKYNKWYSPRECTRTFTPRSELEQ